MANSDFVIYKKVRVRGIIKAGRKIFLLAGMSCLPGTVITREEVLSSKKIVRAENKIAGYYIL